MKMKTKMILGFLAMLCSLYSFAGPRVVGNGFMAPPKKEKTLIEMEIEVEATRDLKKKFQLLIDVARKYSSDEVKIEYNNINRSKNAGNAVLKLAEQFKKSEQYDDAFHHGHLILGRIALFYGDFEKAEKYLNLASKVKSTPVLKSFGPNMTLAKELLEKNRKEAVLNYLEACALFWTDGKEKLETWKKVINTEGGIPDFGANLSY